MPSRIESATTTAFVFPKVMWNFVKRWWWIGLIIIVAVLVIVLYSKYKQAQLKDAFKRRKMEIIEATKINADKKYKDVFITTEGTNLKFIGKYKGHFHTEIKKDSITYVLASRGWFMDFWKGPILAVCPKDAIKDMWVKDVPSLLIHGESFSYDIGKGIYILEGEWSGFDIAISKRWVDQNILDMFQDYSSKLLLVQDQTVQQLDLDLKKKMKGVEDVVEDEQ